ncbi:uncharacterized protein [Primulina huaijiensis]|uniref:uncharacterized protein n=1 Tax=Primulina huaijiensis TaxID=1492673 RepID=UPI003CC734DB
MCAEGLSYLFLKHEASNTFSGLRIAPSCPSISHLFFAVNILVFFKATVEGCVGIRNFLSLCDRASRQLVNFEKSSLSFSINMEVGIAKPNKSILSILIAQGHEVYLGLPNFSARNKKLQFRYLVEKVVKIKQGWGSSMVRRKDRGAAGTPVPERERSLTFQKSHGKSQRSPESTDQKVVFVFLLQNGRSGTGTRPTLTKFRGVNVDALGRRYVDRKRRVIGGTARIDESARNGTAPRGQGNFVTVSELMVNGAWNKPLVQTIFAPYIAQEILAIPLPTIPPKDSRLWPFDSKGKYSVRDGYKVEIGSYESPSHYSLRWFNLDSGGATFGVYYSP